jgi:hypothetical protein
MAKYVELRRHTDADGDVLTPEGVRAAVEIGSRLEGGYEVLVSTGAQRATQTLACFLAGLGERVPHGVVVEPGLRSAAEDRWRAAYEKAGSGTLQALREADPGLVEEDSAALAAALRRILDGVPQGGSRARRRPQSDQRGGRLRPRRPHRRAHFEGWRRATRGGKWSRPRRDTPRPRRTRLSWPPPKSSATGPRLTTARCRA